MQYYNRHFKKVQFNTCFNFLIDNNNNLMTTDILKFENLSSEYDKFCKKYKITNNLKVMNENEFKNVNINWNKLYDSEMQEVVEKIFKDDLIIVMRILLNQNEVKFLLNQEKLIVFSDNKR